MDQGTKHDTNPLIISENKKDPQFAIPEHEKDNESLEFIKNTYFLNKLSYFESRPTEYCTGKRLNIPIIEDF